ncbi:DUF1294 domain-containing protein [Sulfurimonas sp.]|nr:DUF1294 domain-containing protein [Sulfurimonas sp.]
MINFSFDLTYFQIYLITVSLFSFWLYSYDKLIALGVTKNTSRVSEFKLLLSSLSGGSIGSLVAMFLLRHKIKKTSFVVKYTLVILLQFVLIFFIYKGFEF